MSLCTKSGDVPCGTLGCRNPNRCCQSDIGFGCASGATCFTNNASIGCWWTTMTMPTGPRPCYSYAEGASLSNGCGTASWCQLCSQTDYPNCSTNYIAGGGNQVPLTAVWCDSSSGAETTTISAAASVTSIRSSPTIPTASITSLSSPSFPPQAPTTPRPSAPTTPSAPSPSTPTGPNTGSDGGNGGGLSGGALAGIGIGAFFAIAVIGILAFFLWRKQRAPAPTPLTLEPPQPVMSPPPPGYPPYTDQGPYGSGGGYTYPQPQGQGQGQGQVGQGGMGMKTPQGPMTSQGVPMYEVPA